jgi:ATP-binding cassette subfamily F protein 3
LLFVSHDRYFLDRVATQIFAFEADRWRLYAGNYSNYIDSLRRAREESGGNGRPPARGTVKPAPDADRLQVARRKRKFPYRKVDDLEAEIADAEARLRGLHDELADPDLYRDGQRVKESRADYDNVQKQLARLYEHWEEAVELN